MKERKLVIEIDDNAIDSVIEKVRLLKEELRSLSLPINISGAVPAAWAMTPPSNYLQLLDETFSVSETESLATRQH